VERQFDLARRERAMRDGCRDFFSENVAVAVGGRGGFLRTARGLVCNGATGGASAIGNSG